MKMLTTRLFSYGTWFSFIDTILCAHILHLQYSVVTINSGLSGDIEIIVSLYTEMTSIRLYMQDYISGVHEAQSRLDLIKSKLQKQGVRI